MYSDTQQISLNQERTLKRGGSYVPTPDIMPVYEIAEPVSAAHLQVALEHVLRRHDALARPLVEDNGEWYARESRGREFLLEEISLAPHLDRSQILICGMRRRLSFDRLVDAQLYRIPPRAYLAMQFDHLICDGQSIPLLMRDLAAVYGGGIDRLPTPNSYYHLAKHRRDWLASPEATASLAFWETIASEGMLYPDLWLRSAKPGSGVADTATEGPAERRPNAAVAYIDSASTAELHGLYRSLSITAFAGWLCALLIASDQVFGVPANCGISTPFHGRFSSSELATVGYFSYHMPLVLGRPGSFTETAADVMRSIRQSIRHSRVPRWMARHRVPSGGNSAPMFVFQVPDPPPQPGMSIQQIRYGPFIRVGGLFSTDYRSEPQAVAELYRNDLIGEQTQLTLSVYWDQSGGSTLALEFNPDLLDAAEAVALVTKWREVALACR